MATRRGQFLDFLNAGFKATGALDHAYLYVIADFRFFGSFLTEFEGKSEFCQAIVSPLLDAGVTLVIPTFSYTDQGRFDCESTPTRIGALNSWALQQSESLRSEHPLFSVTALGSKREIARGVGKSAFGRDSIFDRLISANAAVLHLGRPVCLGNTAIHYIEEKQDAQYRYLKSFPTQVYRQGSRVGDGYSAFVRRLDVPGHDFISETEKSAKLLFEAGLVCEVNWDEEPMSNLSVYPYDETIRLLDDQFQKDPNLFIQKPFYCSADFKPREA